MKENSRESGSAKDLSLEGLNGTVSVPPKHAGFWRQLLAFAGPAVLVSVGYVDPGNWGTDLAAGAQFKYGLLWVVAMSSLMALFLQVLSARLGVVTGKDLAQCMRDWLPRWCRWPNWILMEIAVAATDLAEVLGSAVALNLLFHIPIAWAVVITGFDVLLLLALQGMGMRFLEALVGVLMLTIGACYGIEIFGLSPTKPDFWEMGRALASPGLAQPGMLLAAIGIIGATVMPHNLYLHSALVQSRKIGRDGESIRTAIRFNTIDSAISLLVAFVINAAILVLAAVVFFGRTGVALAGGETLALGADSDWIRVAHLTLAPLLGTALASVLFAVALLASGQSSTFTGTLAGQVVMEGFMSWRLPAWARRLVTRALAIVPAMAFIVWHGSAHVTDLINVSQVILSLQLPFAIFPLLYFVSRRHYMGEWRPGAFLLAAGWTSAIVIAVLDFYCLPGALKSAWAVLAGR